MKFKSFLTPLTFICLAIFPSTAFSQGKAEEGNSKVGGFKLPDVGYGVFGAAPHINKDASFSNYVPYYARFALWVGALDSKGQPLVTAGTGNSVTPRPEWSPIPGSFQKNEETGLTNVEKVVTTSFSDAMAFDGHTPLGLNVKQQIYGFVEKAFAVITFDISLDPNATPLSEVYVGLWADIDAPETDTELTEGNDLLGFLGNGKALYVFDSGREGNEFPRLGLIVLGTTNPITTWWVEKAHPETDAEQYDYLKGDAPVTDPTQPGDYRFLLSFGPISLNSGDTFRFPIALVQSSKVGVFESSLNSAEAFYRSELGGATLKKSSSAALSKLAASATVPEAFQLRQNFPNPFNPETRIQFDLLEAAQVELNIYNTIGQLVRTLAKGDYAAGTYSLTWNGRDDSGRQLPSGVYIYKIKAGDFQAQRKLLLLK